MLTKTLFLAAALSVTGLATDIDDNEVPYQCRDVCSSIVKLTKDCDVSNYGPNDDVNELACICNAPDSKTKLPLCEACVTQYDSDGADNDVNKLVKKCGFAYATYNTAMPPQTTAGYGAPAAPLVPSTSAPAPSSAPGYGESAPAPAPPAPSSAPGYGESAPAPAPAPTPSSAPGYGESAPAPAPAPAPSSAPGYGESAPAPAPAPSSAPGYGAPAPAPAPSSAPGYGTTAPAPAPVPSSSANGTGSAAPPPPATTGGYGNSTAPSTETLTTSTSAGYGEPSGTSTSGLPAEQTGNLGVKVDTVSWGVLGLAGLGWVVGMM